MARSSARRKKRKKGDDVEILAARAGIDDWLGERLGDDWRCQRVKGRLISFSKGKDGAPGTWKVLRRPGPRRRRLRL